MEYSTGYYTGSIYNRDLILDRDFVGERYCSRSVSTIKVHPQDITLRRQTRGVKKEIALKDRGMRLKCAGGNVQGRDMRRILFIARNPYACILSEFHRTTTSNTRGNSHQMSVIVADFNRTNWQAFAMRAAKEYSSIWNEYLQELLKSSAMQTKFVKYEDFLDKAKRKKILQEVVLFTNRDPDGTCLGKNYITSAFKETSAEYLARIECSFLLADTRRTHRGSASAATNETPLLQRPVNAQIAYREDPKLIEDMWVYLKEVAEYFGYEMKV